MSVDPVFYSVSATATGGRDGAAKTEDGQFSVTLAKPKAMGGNGQGNNPEQLFAAGYAACFLGAMQHVASKDKSYPKVPDDASVHSTVGIGQRVGQQGFGLTAELVVTLPGYDRALAEKLVQETHHVCPYSNATHGNVDVKLSVA